MHVHCVDQKSIRAVSVVLQALKKMATYLGYPDTKQLFEGMLVTVLSCWLEAGLMLDHFPVKLMDYNNVSEFLR